jgi:hypothetical protein
MTPTPLSIRKEERSAAVRFLKIADELYVWARTMLERPLA